ncbi:MAG: hypothetical protein RLZZ507_4753 [Cyanobacteriota bacterium]|jgi:hypothetical protein
MVYGLSEKVLNFFKNPYNTVPLIDYAPLELRDELISMQELAPEKLLEIVKAKQQIQKESQ